MQVILLQNSIKVDNDAILHPIEELRDDVYVGVAEYRGDMIERGGRVDFSVETKKLHFRRTPYHRVIGAEIYPVYVRSDNYLRELNGTA